MQGSSWLSGVPKGRQPFAARALMVFLFLFLCASSAIAVTAAGDEPSEQLYGVRPTPEDAKQALAEGRRLKLPTDLEAAELMPHRDLDRGEAVALASTVFGDILEGTAGPYNDLEVHKFLSDNVAIVDSGTLSASSVEDSEDVDSTGAVLLESTIPLRTEGDSGDQEPLDLDLERAGGELQPENPLVDVEVPAELGEGIELPETGITISLANAAEERTPTTAFQSTAIYPNVAEDTDVIVAPTPTGVETFQQLRSPEAAHAQTYDLSIPFGASIQRTDDGGAKVTQGEETLMVIPAPIGLDAAGASVPTDLAISGNSLSVTATPSSSAVYPILIDPLFEGYNWTTNPQQFPGEPGKDFWAFGGWVSATNSSSMEVSETEILGPNWRSGLYVLARSPNQAPNQGNWNYYVPRFTSDFTKYGVRPTTYINGAVLRQLEFKFWEGYEPNGISRQNAPYFQGGIWDSINGGWIAVASRNGVEGQLLDPTYSYIFENKNHNVNGKNFGVGLFGLEPFTQKWGMRSLYVGIASIELTDNDAPSIQVKSPSGWQNDQAPAVIPFSTSDLGLGVYKFVVEQPSGVSGEKTIETKQGCAGGVYHPCPRTWSSTDPNSPQIAYEPATMPTGEQWIKIAAVDPIGHSSKEKEAQQAEVRIKVDHTPPALSIGGPLAEVAAVGESWPFYNLSIEASDGTKTAPQSGIVKTAIKVDGKVVNEVAPGCEMQSCGSYRSWTLEASDFSAGKHTLEVTATDGVGLSMTKTRTFKLDPKPAPELDLSGSLTEQEALGPSRPRYALEVEASTEAGQKYEAPAPIATFEFGKGQVGEPEDVAVDSAGNVWISRPGENAIKEFDRRGKYLKQVGAYSASGCGLSGPRDIAVDSVDNLWIANGNGRVTKYNPKGECVLVFGGSGKGEASIGNASCVGIAPNGNVWVCDWEANKVSRFTATGSYLGQFGSKGTGKGQFSSPNDIAFGPGGEAWVSDGKRVQKFNAAGQFLLQIEENGWSNGEINGPSGLAVDAEGNLFVVETSGNRIQEFNSEGEHRSSFGSYGTSLGQVYWPTGIAIDADGGFWVADTHNSRIQKWIAPRRPLEPVLTVGGSGSGNGQFNAPSDIAIDAQGNHWVVDTKNNRIQKFGPEGEYLSQFGSAGTGKGQLKEPSGIAIDSAGTLWISDSGNERIVHFAADGKYLGEAEKYKGFTPKTPTGIAIDQMETIWVADASNGRIVRFGPVGEYLGEWIGSLGSGNGQLKEPRGLAIDREGHLLVADSGNNRIETLDEVGTYLGEIGDKNSGRGRLNRPLDVSVDGDGNIWASSLESLDAVEFSPQGEYLNRFGWTSGQMGISGANGIATDHDGNVWVVAGGGNQLQAWRTSEASASLSVSAGSKGTGDGQLSSPKGIATDAAGNHWVVDSQNARIEKFGPEGEYLGKFGEKGSGTTQLNTPYGVAVDASGNLWVTDAGNGRIKHFSPQGKYLGQAESIANVTPSYPTGIAIDAEEAIWVTDIGKGRVVRFGPEGEYLGEWIGASGSGKGQLSSPFGVAADPEGNIWVADTNNKRLQKFDSVGKFLGEFGKEGSGDGSLSRPIGVAVDSQGTVWATDASNGRVKAFDSHGKYLGRFGPGAGTQPLTEPFGVSAGTDGRVWVADQAANRIQAWVPAPVDGSTSELSTEISVDGDQVYENTASCAASNCSMEPKWLLDASGYEEGEHLVEVSATDAYGRTTTEELEVEVEPDKVKPTIDAGGELFNAPEGWVEQDSYSLNASAADAGYGVTSIALAIDGEPVASTTDECPDGGCKALLSETVNFGGYAGGAHSAELAATDGAGNVTSKAWTINVDPDGHISSSEAVATLEALESTSPANAIGEAEEEAIEGTQDGMSIVTTQAGLEASGSAALTNFSPSPTKGFTVEVPEAIVVDCGQGTESISEKELSGQEEEELPVASDASCTGDPPGLVPVTVTPVTVSENADPAIVTPGAAAMLVTNLNSNVDQITRPLYDGALTFTDIRNVSGPESFSWTVGIENDQKLVQTNSDQIVVYYDSGHPAFTITAVPAHDAIGTAVETSLSMSGTNVITLAVDHRAKSYVYPVIAGAGWEGGFQTYAVEMPPPEPMPEEELEEWEEEFEESPDGELRLALSSYGPPVASSSASVPTAAQGSTVKPQHRAYNFDYCTWGSGTPPGLLPGQKRVLKAQASKQCHGHSYGPYGEVVAINWAISMSGVFHYKYGHFVWINEGPKCRAWGPNRPALVNCDPQAQITSNGHIDIIGDYRFKENVFGPPFQATCWRGDGVLPIRPGEPIPGEPVFHGRLHRWWVSLPPDEKCPWGHFPSSALGR